MICVLVDIYIILIKCAAGGWGERAGGWVAEWYR